MSAAMEQQFQYSILHVILFISSAFATSGESDSYLDLQVPVKPPFSCPQAPKMNLIAHRKEASDLVIGVHTAFEIEIA
jgi:hypothetical protein